LLDGDSPITNTNATVSAGRSDSDPIREDRTTVQTQHADDVEAKRRVLLVEDSEEVRETTIEFINEVGFDVVAVETAEAALALLRENGARFDVIFTDVSLPGMSGIDMVKLLLKADPRQRVIIASGYGADLGKHGFGNGVAVLGKPYDLSTLEKTLNQVLDAEIG
jgi:CheY-like chemotaxis protein